MYIIVAFLLAMAGMSVVIFNRPQVTVAPTININVQIGVLNIEPSGEKEFSHDGQDYKFEWSTTGAEGKYQSCKGDLFFKDKKGEWSVLDTVVKKNMACAENNRWVNDLKNTPLQILDALKTAIGI